MNHPIPVETLTQEAFQSFGSFHPMAAPTGTAIGQSPILFHRDLMVQRLGTASGASFSVCKVDPRPPLIDMSECHNHAAEMLMPMDGDTVMHFAPATPLSEPWPAARVRAFRVPSLTMVVIHPGVWHHAPFATGNAPVHVLVCLPERTYVNDCHVRSFPSAEQLRIQL